MIEVMTLFVTLLTDHVGTERDHPHDRGVILGGSAASTHQQSTGGAHPAADLVHDEVQVRPVTVRGVTVISVTVRGVTVSQRCNGHKCTVQYK